MTLTHPSGAKTRCTANKRWALARHTPAEWGETGPGVLRVLFRTNDRDALVARITRERRKSRYGETVAVFRLHDGSMIGEPR